MNEELRKYVENSGKRVPTDILSRLRGSSKRMTVYPITVQSQSFNHHNGTKSYHLMMITTASGRAICINRWGKTGQFGELQVMKYATIMEAQKEYAKKEREKTRKGYAPAAGTKEVVAADSSELSKAITLAVFNKMGADAVKYLDPSFDTTGMREAEPTRLDEDTGKIVNDTARRADISAQLEAQRLADAERDRLAALEAYADNETYGRF